MNGDPVEAYLDQLLAKLGGNASHVRRIIDETEAHLSESVEAGVAEGLTLEAAQHRALDRFGPPGKVAGQFAANRRLPDRLIIAELSCRAWLLVGIGMCAIGASSVLSRLLLTMSSKAFVFGDQPGTVYTRAQCVHFLAVQPAAHTCAQAALAENVDDGLLVRFAAGVVGLVLLAGYGWLRRRRRREEKVTVGLLPDGFTATIGVAVFGATGALLLGNGVDQVLIGRSNGAGQFLAEGMAALAVAMISGLSLLRLLAGRVPAGSVKRSAPTGR